MTVASSDSKSGPYNGNDATVAFDFTFQVQQSADVQVVETVTTGGVAIDTVLSLGTDYSIEINEDQGSAPGGTVTLDTAPASGVQITILRDVTLTQGAELPNQGGWYPEVVERALDKLTMLVQQLSEQVSRSVKVSVAEAAVTVADILSQVSVFASAASASADSASDSAGAAADSETEAARQVGLAEDQVGLATIQAGYAAGSATLASQWASKTDGPVADGKYSAQHWAEYAASIMVGQLSYMGAWDASSGAYPAGASLGNFWKVSVAGTTGGVEYFINDDIIYNGTSWDRIDNQAVSTDLFKFNLGVI